MSSEEVPVYVLLGGYIDDVIRFAETLIKGFLKVKQTEKEKKMILIYYYMSYKVVCMYNVC